MLEFRLPEEKDRPLLERYIEEHIAEGETGELTAASGLEHRAFPEWLRHVLDNTLREDSRRCFCLLCFDKNRLEDPENQAQPRLIGFVHLRPWITEADAEVYGHIGYAVRPSERRKGYGTQMMRYGLWFCKEHGLKRAVAGCYKDNAASAGVLIKSGGILYKEKDCFTPGRMSQYYEYYL